MVAGGEKSEGQVVPSDPLYDRVQTMPLGTGPRLTRLVPLSQGDRHPFRSHPAGGAGKLSSPFLSTISYALEVRNC